MKNNKILIGIIIGLAAALVLVLIFMFFPFSHKQPGFGHDFGTRTNFQLKEETKNEIASFFQNTTNMTEIKSYCKENRMYCGYYCTSINKEHEICKSLFNQTRNGNNTMQHGGKPQWNR